MSSLYERLRERREQQDGGLRVVSPAVQPRVPGGAEPEGPAGGHGEGDAAAGGKSPGLIPGERGFRRTPAAGAGGAGAAGGAGGAGSTGSVGSGGSAGSSVGRAHSRAWGRNGGSAARTEKGDEYTAVRLRVQERLATELDQELLSATQQTIDAADRDKIRRLVDEALAEEESLTPPIRRELAESMLAEILGFGPIQPLLDDPEVSEIMINGTDQVYVERSGRLRLSEVRFLSERQLRQLIDKIVMPLGRRIDEANPMVDARLPDGSRVNAIIPPLSLVGPVVTIRKFSRDPLQVADLIRFGTLTPAMAEFIEACVRARLNILVSGGTGSGKTTTLNVLSSFIPADERIVTIEDAAELQLRQEHVVSLETRPANVEGRGEVSVRQLVRNALRMRPDRIVVGEVRTGEALDMLQAMNTGHDGSLTTAHANSPRDALSRLETMALMAGMELPIRAVREQVSSALDVIIHQARLRDGRRVLTHITEVGGMEGDVVVLQDIFRYQIARTTAEGRVEGEFVATGIRPTFSEQLAAAGLELSERLFSTEGGPG